MSLADNTLPSDTFIRRLRAERERQSMSQAALARKMAEVLGVNVDPSAVTRIEQQTRTVRLDEAVAMADVLGVPLATLLLQDDSDDNQEELARLTTELLAARLLWDQAAAEVNRISLNIQAITGGHDLYDAIRAGAGNTLDPEFAAVIDDLAASRKKD